ncbi:MAG: hypothetical protein ACLRI8_06750 [Agathobacter rectalis]
MIEITGYENIGKGKYRTTFDNGTTCVLYRTEAVRYSIMEEPLSVKRITKS